MGLFDWLRRPQPKSIPDSLWQSTVNGLPFLARLTVDKQNALKRLAEAFLHEKEFSTAGGLLLTDEICTSIAAQGCLPILELGLTAYQDWIGIVVYPDEFVVARRLEDENGIVHEFEDVLSGEAWLGGPLLVSWHDVQMAADPDNPGYNVVIHEFAHKLDMLNGEADGLPVLHSGISIEEWESIFFDAYDDFCQRVDSGEDTAIDPYAADDPAEFFAVLSEHFFVAPALIQTDYPALYTLLARYYRQDPLGNA